MDFDYGLLAKYLTGRLSSAEMAEVMKWRALSAENESVFSDLVRLRVSWNYTKYKDEACVDKALVEVNERIDRTNTHRLYFNLLKYVAVLFLVLSFSFAGYEYFKPENEVWITVKPGGEIKKVTLADGTIVWLKEGASLKIPDSFSTTKRQVSLQGDAFFDVAKNDESFYVSTAYLNIGVYGTAFELNVDHEGRRVETTLVRGKISLLDRDWINVLDMQPGEKVTYNRNGNRYETEKIDANLCATWRFNQTVFENETLREIANRLSSKYSVNVNIESSQLARRKFRCVINKDESLTDVLKLLGYLAPIDYKIEGSEVFIWKSRTNK